MPPLKDKRILITGGTGFLGKHVTEALRKTGATVIPAGSSFDLRRVPGAVEMFNLSQPDIVIHLAAVCGGIQANQLLPATFCYDNLIMGANVIELARRRRVEKLVVIGTTCSYPAFCQVPFR